MRTGFYVSYLKHMFKNIKQNILNNTSNSQIKIPLNQEVLSKGTYCDKFSVKHVKSVVWQ